jgi:hypothetical protein
MSRVADNEKPRPGSADLGWHSARLLKCCYHLAYLGRSGASLMETHEVARYAYCDDQEAQSGGPGPAVQALPDRLLEKFDHHFASPPFRVWVQPSVKKGGGDAQQAIWGQTVKVSDTVERSTLIGNPSAENDLFSP